VRVELIVDAQAALGEGALWDARASRLWWVDIDGCRLHAFDPLAGHDVEWPIGQKVTTVVPRRRGGLILGLQHGIAAFDPATGQLTALVDPEAHLPDNRFNDGKCDPQGRFWAGTMSMVRQPRAASLYCLDADGRVSQRLEGVTTSNGLCWSRDGRTMYYIDTGTRQVDRFDFDPDAGAISNRRPIIRFADGMGRPDGMTIDADGMLWIAHWDGSAVTRWNPDSGTMLMRIDVPALNVSSCALGGPKLDTLYITTARNRTSPEQLERFPHAGGLFACVPGPVGLPAFEYAG